MRKLYSAVLVLFFLPQFLAAQNDNVIARNPDVIVGQLIRTTQPLGKFRKPDGWIDVPVRDENGRIWPDDKRPVPVVPTIYPGQQETIDRALQTAYPKSSANDSRAARSVGANFNGMGYTFVNPPDPSVCVGPNHVIQMINGGSGAYFKVFNKSGVQVVAQTYLDQITGRGGLGDPIAEYDHIADRFVLMEFANKSENGNQEGLIIAVSQSGDPTGGWNVYFYGYGNTFPDYPKLSVWTDAYYCTTNDFASAISYVGTSVWAFDRAAMIAGSATASAQRFTIGSASKHFSSCPVLLQGNAVPPSGTGGLIAYMQDNAWTSSTTDVDSVGMLEFDVNFSTPANSTISHRASLATAAFKSDICTASRGRCISQPGSTIALEALQQKIMNQPVYRNFGTYEGIVLTHIVDKGANISGVRWYELNKTTGNWNINQQSTYTPDNTHRFMPGICYDNGGNIGLVYNVSSSATSVFPGVRYTGRKQCDPLNTMTYSEDIIVAGAAANGSSRYGDYNHVVADPDGTTFWMTAEWNGTSQWSTRIASFTLDPCTPVCASPSGLTASAITTNNATVSWTAVGTPLSHDVDYKEASSSTWINAATATTSTSVNLSGLNPSVLYDYRVRSNCATGSSAYSSAQFTTAATPPLCGTPTGLAESGITTNSATVLWTAVPNALSYDVDYKQSSSGTWINAAAATTATSVNLISLSAATSYDWRVRATCAAGAGSYATDAFTTSAPPVTCPGPYDVGTNGTTGGAATIPLNTDVRGAVDPRGDNDYYRFVINTAGTVSITLGTLPANYQLAIVNSGGATINISQNNGTTSETINASLGGGEYYARVFPKGNASSTLCYTLRVTTGTASSPDSDMLTRAEVKAPQVKVFPNPANSTLLVNISNFKGTTRLSLFDITGRLVRDRMVQTANSAMNISTLSPGTYALRMRNADGTVSTVKVVKY